MKILQALYVVASASLIVWLFCAPLAWILRDGLGPSAVASTGFDAVLRFLSNFYWGPIALALAATTFVLRKRIGRRSAS